MGALLRNTEKKNIYDILVFGWHYTPSKQNEKQPKIKNETVFDDSKA